MNQHLNIFNPYTKTNRITNQLENDLTRALALTLLEDNLFLYTFIKHIVSNKEGVFEQILNSNNDFKNTEITIQKKISAIKHDFDHLFAVGISGLNIKTGDAFFNSKHDKNYEPITDIFISIGNTAIVLEIKPNNVDCTDQLYNQIFNLYNEEPTPNNVTSINYPWQTIIKQAIEINNFQKITKVPTRFLNDFIGYIRNHNYSWLPENPLQHLTFNHQNIPQIESRLRTILSKSSLNELNKTDRIAFSCSKNWADEIILWLRPNKKIIQFGVYPANTKGQGHYIFKNEGIPQFKTELNINDTIYPVNVNYHIKLSSFQSYFTGLDFTTNDLNEQFYTRTNFKKYTGRKKRDTGDWDKLALLFDQCFKPSFNWREKAKWERKVIKSGKSQFDISFGYGVSLDIPYQTISELDNDHINMNNITDFIKNIGLELEGIFY